jgi:hypothetical protein
VGILQFTNGLTWGPGGFYRAEVQDAAGGPGGGWDSTQVTGALTFTATVGSPFTIFLASLNSSGAGGIPANFIPTNAYAWPILSATSFVGFNPAAVTLDTSGFAASLDGGVFSLSTSGGSLLVNFTPVPEPSTWALIIGGLGLVTISSLRRRRMLGKSTQERCSAVDVVR